MCVCQLVFCPSCFHRCHDVERTWRTKARNACSDFLLTFLRFASRSVNGLLETSLKRGRRGGEETRSRIDDGRRNRHAVYRVTGRWGLELSHAWALVLHVLKTQRRRFGSTGTTFCNMFIRTREYIWLVYAVNYYKNTPLSHYAMRRVHCVTTTPHTVGQPRQLIVYTIINFLSDEGNVLLLLQPFFLRYARWDPLG